MADKFYTILTSIGKNKLANSVVLGNKVNLKTLKVGDGNGTYHEPSENQTTLINKVWEGNINSISVDESNSNWIVIETIIPATDGGFFIREAGIFDEAGDLIAVSKISETYKPVISEGSMKDVSIKIILEVSNVDSIELKIDPNVTVATKKDIETLESKIENTNTQLSDLSNKVISHLKDDENHIPYVLATGQANSYEVALNPAPTDYVDGMALCMKLSAASNGPSTLNVNKLGARAIKDCIGNEISNGGLKANIPYTMRYEVTNQSFILQGYYSSKIFVRTNDPGNEAALYDVWLDLTNNVFKVKLSAESWKIIGAAYN